MGGKRVVIHGMTLVLVATVPASLAGKRPRVPEPPDRFEEQWYSVSRPPGEGWALMRHGEQDVAMAREGKAADETYAVSVGVLRGDPALSPDQFVRNAEEQHRAALGTGRFTLKQWSAELDAKRPQACMRYRFTVVDEEAERITGRSGPMLLEGMGLTCQVPGGAPFVVDAHWSHRTEIGREDPQVAVEADRWLGSLVLTGPSPAAMAPASAASQGSPAPATVPAAIAGENPEDWVRLAERHENGDGVPQDLGKALELYRRAAQAGLAGAQVEMGCFYMDGKGVAQDFAEARRWFELAAAQGRATALMNLGVLVDEGRGGPVDDARAVKLYRQAAEKGESRAQLNLAVMLWTGEGVERDPVDALAWLNVVVLTASDAEAHQSATAALNSYGARVSRNDRRRGQERAIAWLDEHGYTSAATKAK